MVVSHSLSIRFVVRGNMKPFCWKPWLYYILCSSCTLKFSMNMLIHCYYIATYILRAWCKTIVTTLFYIRSYNSFATSPRYYVHRILVGDIMILLYLFIYVDIVMTSVHLTFLKPTGIWIDFVLYTVCKYWTYWHFRHVTSYMRLYSRSA